MPPPKTQRRINVSSGRPLEAVARYSRALRVGACVLQSGTTAIDREGNVIGEGDIARQVDAIFGIAGESMAAAGGALDDVVCARLYVVGAEVDAACRAAARHLQRARPALSVVPVSGLARPAQLVEIELEAMDGAGSGAVRVTRGHPSEDRYAASAAVRVGARVWVGGIAAASGAAQEPDPYTQTRRAYGWLGGLLEDAGAQLGDVVCTRTSLRNLGDAEAHRRGRRDALGATRPASTLLGTPAFADPAQRFEVEAEAWIGAHRERREVGSEAARERALGFARAVAAGERIHVSGCTSLDAAGEVVAPGDWAVQFDRCLEQIETALVSLGASLDDVVQRRTFTVAGVTRNRPYGEGPAWFESSRPTALGCSIDALARPGLVVEVDAWAVRGAHAGIEWRELPR